MALKSSRGSREGKRSPSVRRDKRPTPKTVQARPKTRPKRGARLGTLTLTASSQTRVAVDGRSVGTAPSSVAVRKGEGRIKLSNAPGIDYAVTLDYRVDDSGLLVTVNAAPWAIVKHNGLSLGKTPQGPVPAGRRHRFSLLRPGQASPFVVSLLWNPKSP